MSKNECYMALKGLLHWHLLFNFRHTFFHTILLLSFTSPRLNFKSLQLGTSGKCSLSIVVFKTQKKNTPKKVKYRKKMNTSLSRPKPIWRKRLLLWAEMLKWYEIENTIYPILLHTNLTSGPASCHGWKLWGCQPGVSCSSFTRGVRWHPSLDSFLHSL